MGENENKEKKSEPSSIFLTNIFNCCDFWFILFCFELCDDRRSYSVHKPPILRGLKAVMINSLNPQFIGEVNSWTQTCDFSHLVASTCCRTKARPLN